MLEILEQKEHCRLAHLRQEQTQFQHYQDCRLHSRRCRLLRQRLQHHLLRHHHRHRLMILLLGHRLS
jgi:hypothetical protein